MDEKESKLKGLALAVRPGERIALKVGETIVWVGLGIDRKRRLKLVFDAPQSCVVIRESILRRLGSCQI